MQHHLALARNLSYNLQQPMYPSRPVSSSCPSALANVMFYSFRSLTSLLLSTKDKQLAMIRFPWNTVKQRLCFCYTDITYYKVKSVQVHQITKIERLLKSDSSFSVSWDEFVSTRNRLRNLNLLLAPSPEITNARYVWYMVHWLRRQIVIPFRKSATKNDDKVTKTRCCRCRWTTNWVLVSTTTSTCILVRHMHKVLFATLFVSSIKYPARMS